MKRGEEDGDTQVAKPREYPRDLRRALSRAGIPYPWRQKTRNMVQQLKSGKRAATNQIKDRAQRVSKGRKAAQQISEAWDPVHESSKPWKTTAAKK